MGLFGDFFSDPGLFDIDGDGNVDMFEEMVAMDMIFGDSSRPAKNSPDPFDFDDSDDYDDPFSFDDDDEDDPFDSDDFGDYSFDF